MTNWDRIWAVAGRFATGDCLGFGLDLVGTAAVTIGGPYGVPMAAAAFATSAALDAKEGD